MIWYIKLPLTQCPYYTAFSAPQRRMLYTLFQLLSRNLAFPKLAVRHPHG